MMRTFSLFTIDTRYTVPTLTVLTVEDEQRAIEQAQANLDQSEFHRAVELWDGERTIYLRQKAA
jgi:hypothetical protein